MANPRAYYNDTDEYVCNWLCNLMAEGLIPEGDVDQRSIRDVTPGDLRGYTQCHFFAGLGGWPYALRLAGWPDDREVWTGSCPCQPFSAAGKREGFADDRHLWPVWFSLIHERKPAIVFGEQVARAIGHAWLDQISNDMEAEGYAFGAAVLPACAVDAPHVRDRIWFVADRNSEGWAIPECETFCGTRGREEGRTTCKCRELLAYAHGHYKQRGSCSMQVGWRRGQSQDESDGGRRHFKWPAEPDLSRVAHGIPARVAKLRALGNAIVPQVAAEFIKAYMSL